MVGQTIESHRPFPRLVLLWAALALALDVLALAEASAHWAILSLFPWVLTALWPLTRGRAFRAEFTRTSLEVEEPPVSIPYDDIETVLASSRPANPYEAGPPSYPMRVIHAGGALRIPARLNVPSDEVFGFLFHQVSGRRRREVHPALVDYLRHKEREFGPERVWVTVARSYMVRRAPPAALTLFCLGLFLTGVAWLAVGVAADLPGWGLAGGIVAFAGGLFALLLWLATRSATAPVKKALRQASLIVCPDGLALAQGDLTGQMRWDEVRDARLTAGVLMVKVEGAVIPIQNLYDRPLRLIHDWIRYHWKGEDIPWLDQMPRAAPPAELTAEEVEPDNREEIRLPPRRDPFAP